MFLAPLVPDGWTVTGTPGAFYELLPPSGPGAIHISVYTRPDRPMQPNEARDALAGFLVKAIHSSDGQIRVLRDSPEQQRAFSRVVHQDDTGQQTEWFAACIMWLKHLLVCTYNAPLGEGDLPTAERMIASIVPAQ